MTISRQNLSIIIVTFKSEKVIHQCLKSIPEEIQVIIVENQYQLVNYFKKNLISDEIVIGMGAGLITHWMRNLKSSL